MRRLAVGLGCTLWGLFAPANPLLLAQSLPKNLHQPAATLLLPYFEVDLADAQGTTTMFSVNNASASAGMAHVTIWSDFGVPVHGFDIYLTGYDVQSIDLRNVLQGIVPATASAGQDPFDTATPTSGISNQGPLSQDINVASCNGLLPRPNLAAGDVDALQAALTGSASTLLGGLCATRAPVGNRVARGYVTIDATTQCTSLHPSDAGYFGGVADARNIYFGDYVIVNPAQETAFGDNLVSVTADWPPTSDPELTTPGEYTFYGAFTAWTAADRREPLSTTFAARFIAPKDFKGSASKANRRAFLAPSTELLVWRDPKVKVPAFACGTEPLFYPLTHEDILAFDEAENPERPTFEHPPFGKATQRVTLGGSAVPLTTTSGWLYLNLNHRHSANPAEDGAAAQAWVVVLHRAQQGPNGGRYDAGFRAIRLDSAREASHYTYLPLP